MAILYRADITPSKMDLLSAWLPNQPWLGGANVQTLGAIGSYRFDDPDGEVGIETLLLDADGATLQVPVTYRGSPLEEAQAELIGTTHHSVLGKRWVYDACGDPVYARALATTILRGGSQAELHVVTDSGHESREPVIKVAGSGKPDSELPHFGGVAYVHDGPTTVVRCGDCQMNVARIIAVDEPYGRLGAGNLRGTWPGQEISKLLAWLTE